MNIDRTFLDAKSPPGSIGGLYLSSKRSLGRLLAHLRLNRCPTAYIPTTVHVGLKRAGTRTWELGTSPTSSGGPLYPT